MVYEYQYHLRFYTRVLIYIPALFITPLPSPSPHLHSPVFRLSALSAYCILTSYPSAAGTNQLDILLLFTVITLYCR
ncbi:hypothetical protein L218DRAFT_371311 [Marasmius fiardii PR-910]|nr:hypothetical protein L218DRAFT_371311 [Marasmius fiardii PR-910]